jgi:LacI family gluconate utilization system Gnt-I transcriptional repressor
MPASIPAPAASVEEHSRGSITLREVAKAAGVSAMTVSRVLNAPGRVNADTRRRVDEAIRRLGYVPNLAANSLRSSRSYLVTALVPTMTGSLFSGMVRSLTEALEERGFQLMVGQSGYGRSREDDLLRAIIGRRPDGIVLTGIMHSPQGRAMLLSSGIPVVETWDTTPDPIDMLLRLSHEQIGRRVCAYLHDGGRRRLALLSGDDERAERRTAGFLQEAAARGLPEPLIRRVPAPTTHAQGRNGLGELLEAEPTTEGVFCSSDMMAAGVITEARQRGIEVPGRLAVVGFGDLDFAASMLPGVTTVRVDGGAIGTKAAAMIAARASGEPVRERIVDVEFSIVRRDSA